MAHRSHSHSLRHLLLAVVVHAARALCLLKMADECERIRNSEWKDDETLEADLQKYVLQNLSRREILDFLKRDFPQYAWSLGTLSRRLAHFDIKYVRYDIDLQEVENAVRDEVEGPGQLLGYRAMQKKLREVHNLAVPRGLVHDVMGMVDPDGLERRGNVGQRKRRRGATGTFTSLVQYE